MQPLINDLLLDRLALGSVAPRVLRLGLHHFTILTVPRDDAVFAVRHVAHYPFDDHRRTTGNLRALKTRPVTTDVASFRRTDSAFHMTIAPASGNPLLAKAVEDARSASFMMFDTSNFEILKASSALAHNVILEAIATGDSTAAASLMSAHLPEAWSEIDAVIDAAPDMRCDPTPAADRLRSLG